MKLKMLILGLILTATTSAFAQIFSARAMAFVTPLEVAVEVFNPYYEPIACRGQVIGQTVHGQILANGFFDAFIPAGAVRRGFVYTNVYNQFVGGRAEIVCNFLRPF